MGTSRPILPSLTHAHASAFLLSLSLSLPKHIEKHTQTHSSLCLSKHTRREKSTLGAKGTQVSCGAAHRAPRRVHSQLLLDTLGRIFSHLPRCKDTKQATVRIIANAGEPQSAAEIRTAEKNSKKSCDREIGREIDR
jgi:hypothetical protein